MVWVVQILAPVVYQCSERMFFVYKTQTFSWQNWPVSYLLLPQMVPDINWNIRNSFPDPLVGWMDAATQDGWFAKTVKREAGNFRNLARSWIFQDNYCCGERGSIICYYLVLAIFWSLSVAESPSDQNTSNYWHCSFIKFIFSCTLLRFFLLSRGLYFAPSGLYFARSLSNILCVGGDAGKAVPWKHNLWHSRGNYPAVWNSGNIKHSHLFPLNAALFRFKI